MTNVADGLFQIESLFTGALFGIVVTLIVFAVIVFVFVRRGVLEYNFVPRDKIPEGPVLSSRIKEVDSKVGDVNTTLVDLEERLAELEKSTMKKER